MPVHQRILELSLKHCTKRISSVLPLYFPAKAGVFVSASAGNAGPEPVTLGHVAPWYLAVAARSADCHISS